MKKTTNDWFESAKSDLLLIKNILEIEGLTHLSAVHAQQAIEKSFKALAEEFQIGIVKTHSLEMLFHKIRSHYNSDIEMDLIIILDQIYIDSRYPGELGLLPNGKPTLNESKQFYGVALQIMETCQSMCNNNS
jgi:HEPN domain-containing protein